MTMGAYLCFYDFSTVFSEFFRLSLLSVNFFTLTLFCQSFHFNLFFLCLDFSKFLSHLYVIAYKLPYLFYGLILFAHSKQRSWRINRMALYKRNVSDFPYAAKPLSDLLSLSRNISLSYHSIKAHFINELLLNGNETINGKYGKGSVQPVWIYPLSRIKS